MSVLFDLYYNSFETKIEKVLESKEIEAQKNLLLKHLTNENKNLLNDLLFDITNALENLMDKEREIALNRGIKIGMELQNFFDDEQQI